MRKAASLTPGASPFPVGKVGLGGRVTGWGAGGRGGFGVGWWLCVFLVVVGTRSPRGAVLKAAPSLPERALAASFAFLAELEEWVGKKSRCLARSVASLAQAISAQCRRAPGRPRSAVAAMWRAIGVSPEPEQPA